MMGFNHVLRLIVLISVIATLPGCPSQCEIGSQDEGAEVQVTCHFSQRLSNLQTYAVSVTHYPGEKGDPAFVLSFNRNGIEVQDSVAKGYSVNSQNETHVTFTVAAASHVQNGSYCPKVLSTSGNTTTCVAPSAPNGKLAHVTCKFNRDVSQLDTYTVAVEYFRGEKENPEPVLLCTHIGTLQCLISKGYTFDYKVDYNLRLLIPEVSDQHVGRYACNVLSPKIPETVPQFCMLELTDTSSSSTSILLVVGTAAVALLVGLVAGGFIGGCYFSKRRSRENTDAARPMSTTTDPLLEEENTDAARPMSTTTDPLLEEERL